jgi:PilZ domain
MRLSAETYETIVAALKSDSQREKNKRREPRVGVAGEAEFVTVDSAGKRIAGTVRVRDVSPSGIGLLLSQQIAAKQRFVIQLYAANRDPLWLVCLAAYCRKVDGGVYSVGAKIQQVLRAEQIQKLESPPAAAAAVKVPARQRQVNQSDVERISKAILG